MTAWRGCVLIGAFTAIALSIVYLRVEQTRCAAQTLALEVKWVETRRELWSLQAAAARLRTPGRVHDRLVRFETDLIPPAADDGAEPVRRFAASHP